MTVTAEDRRQVHEACKELEKFNGRVNVILGNYIFDSPRYPG